MLQFYDELNWFQKLLYRFHLKKAITSFKKKDLKDLVRCQMNLERMEIDNKSYNELIQERFNGI